MPRADRQQQPQFLLLLLVVSIATGTATVGTQQLQLQQEQEQQRASVGGAAALAAQTLTQSQLQSAQQTIETQIAAAGAGVAASVATSDAFYIRHGRSRVRHHAGERTNVLLGNSSNNNASSSNSGTHERTRTRLMLVTEPSVLMLAGSGRTTDLASLSVPTQYPGEGTSSAPVTHKIRKLHKKKINESIRKSVDKSLGVLHPAKNHRSLAEAEHLQGRPTDVDEDPRHGGVHSAALGEVMQLADEIELENSLESAYQNVDDFEASPLALTVTPTTAVLASSNSAADAVAAAVAAVPPTTTMLPYGSQSTLDMGDDGRPYAAAEDVTFASDTDSSLGAARGKSGFYTALSRDGAFNRTYSAASASAASGHDLAASKVRHVHAANLASSTEDSTESDYERAVDVLAEVGDADGFELAPAADASDANVFAVAVNNEIENANNVAAAAGGAGADAGVDGIDGSIADADADGDDTDADAADDAIADANADNDANADDDDDDDDDDEPNNIEAGFAAGMADDVSMQYVLDESADGSLRNDSDWESTTALSTDGIWAEEHSPGPRHSASTSVSGGGLSGLGELEAKQINFEDTGVLDTSEVTMDDGYPPEVIIDDNTKQLVIGDVEGDVDVDGLESDQIRADVINARDNKIDLVSKFLQYIEQQHLLGSNCVAGTSLNLGEGVVDRYAQDRFRVEAEVAVNRANMLTRIFKMTSRSAQEDVNLLHASVLSMVEFDDDIFAAGNCFDWNEHPAQPGLFCPFAYRLPPPNLGAIFAKDLATEYHYLGNTSEWFFLARKNAEKVIARNEQYLKSFHLYSNRTEERIEDDTLAVKYEDGRWSKPYYDCGGGNIWMLTYTVPFFGYENGSYHFKGTSGIDIDLRRVDIDQCPQRSVPGTKRPLNIFAGTDKCKQRTTMCEAINGLGFRRGSYKCICRKGFYFPDVISTQKFFNGSLLEEEYEKLMLGKNSTYSTNNEYECLPCAEGCDFCEDASPCIAALNWPMRTSILVLACIVIGLLPPAAWFTFRYQQVKVVRAASPALLRVIALGAFFIYCTNIVMYPNPNLYTCTARIWLREIGFSLTYGALMLKTWRISVIFRVRSAKAVKITDAALLKRLGVICGAIGTCLLVRTLVSPPDVVVGRTADDLKAFLCKTDWWDYTFTSMEVLFLAWGVRLCIMVRKAPSEFNESRFISMAIYNEFLLTCFLNVSMLFLHSPANPDLLYIIFFCHTQLTVTLLLALIFGSKVYIVLRSGKSHQENIGLGAKSSGAKFNFRPQVRTFANPSSVTTSTAPVAGTTSAENKLSDQEALEEIRQLSVQLQRIQEMAPPKGVAVMTISSLLDGLKTPGGMMMVAAAATQAATASQALHRHQAPQGALPLLALNAEIQKYNQQMHQQPPVANNNIMSQANGDSGSCATARAARMSIPTMVLETPPSPTPPTPTFEERAINTELSGANFYEQLLRRTTEGHLVCSRCLDASKEHYYCCPPRTRPATAKTACEQLGSPQPEGSISFANIKLECMCSQSDDLELDADAAAAATAADKDADAQLPAQQRRPTMRSAATNTPPAKCKSRQHQQQQQQQQHQQKEQQTNVCYQICDNCRNRYKISNKSSRKRSSLTAERSTSGTGVVGGLMQTRSSDLLDRRSHAADLATAASAKASHSIDDITFYTTTEDDDDADGDAESSSQSSQPSRSSSDAKPCAASGQTQLPDASAAQPQSSSRTTTTTAEQHAPAQSLGNVSNASNNSANQTENGGKANQTEATGSNGANAAGAGGRAKRPDKLVLDLNDRSKYTKEVSV